MQDSQSSISAENTPVAKSQGEGSPVPEMAAKKDKVAASNKTDRLLTILIVLLSVLVLLGIVFLASGYFTHNATPAGSTQTANAGSTSATAGADEEENKPDGQTSQRVKELIKAQQKRDPQDPYALGKVDAPVVIVEYADYRCPYCNLWHQRTFPSLQKYIDAGQVRFEWRDAPIVGGEESIKLALAGRAAAKQGKFWPFHDAVYAASPTDGKRNWEDSDIRALAAAVGVADLDKFEQDRNSDALRQQLQEELQHASQIGIASAPLFLVDDVAFAGAQPIEYFEEVINTALKKAGH